MSKENEIKKGNIKLSVFDEFPLDEHQKICNAITQLGYKGTVVSNGNTVFQKIENEHTN